MRSTKLNGDLDLGPTLDDAVDECGRAHHLHGDASMAGPCHTEADRLAILTEEVGEVAKELNELRMATDNNRIDAYAERMYAELVQVAAMALTWAAVLRPRRDDET